MLIKELWVAAKLCLLRTQSNMARIVLFLTSEELLQLKLTRLKCEVMSTHAIHHVIMGLDCRSESPEDDF